MKSFLTAPGFLSPYGTFGADLSSILAWTFTALFMYGWWSASHHRGQRHHTVTLWGMIAMIGYFTAYYLARSLGALALEGKEGFGGPEWAYLYIFTPLLTVHILVVAVGLVMAVYMVILGFRASFKKGGERLLKTAPLKMGPKGFRYTLVGAAVAFGLGAIIRWGSLARFIVYLSGFLLVAGVLFLERGIERWIPDAATRHRRLGKFTMSLYVVALVTSTSTYFMLYFIYPPK
jgi:uncharacterized membrane protein YozB (DUF420 family)